MRTHLELADPAKRRWVANAVRLARRRVVSQSFAHLEHLDFNPETSPKWDTREAIPFHNGRDRQGAPVGFPKRDRGAHLDWACDLLGGLAVGLDYDPTQDYNHPVYLSNSQTGEVVGDMEWAVDFWSQSLKEPSTSIGRLYATKDRLHLRRTAVRILVLAVANGADTVCFAPRRQMSSNERARYWKTFSSGKWGPEIWVGSRPKLGSK